MDKPNGTIWLFRLMGPLTTLVFLSIVFALHFKRDVEEDYLKAHFDSYFNRDGFCFAFASSITDGIGFIDVYYQNQFSEPCVGQIAVRPEKDYLGLHDEIGTLIFKIECAGAEFGLTRCSIPIPEELQGVNQYFEVGASVDYPFGKGDRLRFRDGIRLRTNQDFKNSFAKTLTVAGAATGNIVLQKPATTRLYLPDDVAYSLDKQIRETRTIWKPGQPPLESAG